MKKMKKKVIEGVYDYKEVNKEGISSMTLKES